MSEVEELRSRLAEAERLLQALRPAHYECEDAFYSCPSHPDYIGIEDRSLCLCGRNDVIAFLRATVSAADRESASNE